ncbi:TPA: hypothetical protein ACN35K_004423 [Vibrio parahaemolyticus]
MKKILSFLPPFKSRKPPFDIENTVSTMTPSIDIYQENDGVQEIQASPLCICRLKTSRKCIKHCLMLSKQKRDWLH